MKSNVLIGSVIAVALAAGVPLMALADTTPLAATCSGSASATAITWTGSTSGGVTPVSLLWGNGATTPSQTVPEAPGTYSMTLTATDASSTVATTTCSATVASSTSSGGTSLLDQIKAILAQIAALKQQLLGLVGSGNESSGNASSTPSVNGCPVLNRNLGPGDRGDDVKGLQQFLEANDDTFTGSATGFFGPLTQKALMHFQLTNGIASSTTGTVGPLTRHFFGKHCGEIEGMGHLKGTAQSWMDASSSHDLPPGLAKQHGHDGNASSSEDNGSDH